MRYRLQRLLMHPKRGFALLALACVCALAAVWIMQLTGLEPCPLCWLQRGAVALALLGCALGLISPLSWKRLWVGVSAVGLVLGIVLAGRHLWLQSLPADQVPACLPSMGYMLEVFPLWQVVSDIVFSDGHCADVGWTFLGISIPGWMFIFCIKGLLLLLDQLYPLFPVAKESAGE